MAEQLTLFSQMAYGIEVNADIDIVWTDKVPNLIGIPEKCPGIYKISRNNHLIGWLYLSDVKVIERPGYLTDDYEHHLLENVENFVPNASHFIDISWVDANNQGGRGYGANTAKDAIEYVSWLLDHLAQDKK